VAEQLSEFLARTPPPVRFIIGRGVLPVQGKLIIGGPPKANKSFVAMNIAVDLARGRNIFDAKYPDGRIVLPVEKTYRVLYIEQEIGEHSVRERLARMLVGVPNIENLTFFVKTKDIGMRLDSPDGQAAIFAEIEEVKPDVVLLDPLAKFHLVEENSARDMSAIMRIGDMIIQRYKTALVIVHHEGKENHDSPRRGLDKLRGSSVIAADTDSFLDVIRRSSKHAPEPVLELSFEIRHDAPIEPLYVRRRLDGLIDFIPNYQEMRTGQTISNVNRKKDWLYQ
jgi:RecA-family ATPase